MKLASFYEPHAGVSWGCVIDNQVVGLGEQEGGETLVQALAACGGTLAAFAAEVLNRMKRRHGGELPTYSWSRLDVAHHHTVPHLTLPVAADEVWGCGVTYLRSASERDADSQKDIYTQVYESDRPEIFFKATPRCCVGPNDEIGIRSDSELTAAEPELAVVLGASAEVVGYTICNDVSAWDLERANPLYLPQSKTFKGCCAIGPVMVTADELPDPYSLEIVCRIMRDGEVRFEGSTTTAQLGRKIDSLVECLTRNNPVPIGTVLTTGTGIMIPNEHALQHGDTVEIEIDGIGVLSNPVCRLPS